MKKKIKVDFKDASPLILDLALIIILLMVLVFDNNLSVVVKTTIYIMLITSILLFFSFSVLVYLKGKIKASNQYRNYLLDKMEQNINSIKIDTSDSKFNMDHYFVDGLLEESDNDDGNNYRRRASRKGGARNTAHINKSDSNTDIFALMLKNNDEINEYFKISKSQAKVSFYFSIFACILGFIMLGFAVYGVFQIENMQIAIVGTVSGAITEVIAGTVLIIHNKSALQLNHYYDALHQDERFLSAVSMAQQLSDENREDMYMEIIRKQIEVAANDTNHEKTIDITKGSEENT